MGFGTHRSFHQAPVEYGLDHIERCARLVEGTLFGEWFLKGNQFWSSPILRKPIYIYILKGSPSAHGLSSDPSATPSHSHGIGRAG